MNPLVSCICPTRDRREWLPRAIECFLRQTYAPCELLILADGSPVADLIPASDRIRHVRCPDGLTVGRKRNMACALTSGEIIAHWDDDDHSSPQRLADQVARLTRTQKAVTGYHTMKFTDGLRWYQYRGSAGFVLGTSLCYRRDWGAERPFPDFQIGEDAAFVAAASGQHQLAPAGDLNLMYATIHGLNTSRRVVSPGSWIGLDGYEWQESAA
jgi:O-antigen biosynthesis protein